MAAFHPVGFRAMARAAAEDLRPMLSLVTLPTLLVYGADDVRAPRPVADHLHASIADSMLTVLPHTGHVVNLERPDEFNTAVRTFLAGVR
jgi:pimeloyl-ACP methyl ester carboxylesterase